MSKNGFGKVVGVLVIIAFALVARKLLSSGTTNLMKNPQSAEQVQQEEGNEEYIQGEQKRQNVGSVKETASKKLPEGEKSPDCVDYRDGGDDIFTKGSTYSQGKLRQEYCNFQDNPANTHVNEFSCNRTDPIADNRVKCPEGYSCADGACVAKNTTGTGKKVEMKTADNQNTVAATGDKVTGVVSTGTK